MLFAFAVFFIAAFFKKNVNYNTKICSDCGFSFSELESTNYNEIAQIYNARLEQYKKNPFYEHYWYVHTLH